MRRPLQIWLAFAACAAIVVAALAWLTREAVRADLARSSADAREDLQRRINLALWRMDTKLAPLLASEAARPAYYYDALLPSDNGGGYGASVQPSPLAAGAPDNVLLNFACASNGQWSSPQATQPAQEIGGSQSWLPAQQVAANSKRLSELAAQVNVADLLKQLPSESLPSATGPQEQLSWDLQTESPGSFYGNYAFVAPNSAPPEAQANQQASAPRKGSPRDEQQAAPQQLAGGGDNDLQQRSSRYQSVTQQEFVKQRRENPYNVSFENAPANRGVVEGVSRPLWVDDELLLARRVTQGDQQRVVGSWLDWPAIRTDLLSEVNDLLPDASLQPVTDVDAADPSRMLAGIPAMIVPREKLLVFGITPAMTWALAIGWTALVVALAAVAALLAGVIALSERRAAFVSSVTHELRTPLTTFRMYAEMLAAGMVPSEERRREYLATLQTEAERLSRLVENVLSYARLERGRRPERVDRLTAAALLDRFADRLRQRAAQAEMQLELEVAPAAADAKLLTDAGVVEQILFNLVDNAAKYAARADDRRIHVEATVDASRVDFTVRDHGPGFAAGALARRDAPFRKSAQEAAESAPGVGLGLALCRRLAKQLGGTLSVESAETGATVVLRLPRDA